MHGSQRFSVSIGFRFLISLHFPLRTTAVRLRIEDSSSAQSHCVYMRAWRRHTRRISAQADFAWQFVSEMPYY